ncbi:MAG: hypothetical protein IT480_10060 [Gammaproteobacteria bacterium]|nr:hypothetical protein [Gammaproteobacteria bacterium]
MAREGLERFYRSDDGIDLYYREWGSPSAPLTVVCLPGLTRNSRDFAALAARSSSGQLSGRWRLAVPCCCGVSTPTC